MHLDLTKRSAALLDEMRGKDFGGRDFDQMKHGPFLVQQKVLDGLFLGTMVETDKLL